MDNTKTAAQVVLRWRAPIGQTLIPGLIGPTGAGKTMLATQLAHDAGLQIVTLLLGTMLPEDVLGLPSIVDGVTQWSRPQWAHQAITQPVLLLLDELDKARPEVLATVLTLISSRSIRDIPLHPETVIVVAMQPVEEYWLRESAAEALAARTVWLPITYDYSAIERLGGISLSWATRPSTMHMPVLPVPSARQLLYLAQMRATPVEPDVLRTIAAGVLPESLVDEYVTAPAQTVDAQSFWHMTEGLDAYLAAVSDSHAVEIAMEPGEHDVPHDAALIKRLINMTDYDLRHGDLRHAVARMVRHVGGSVHSHTEHLLLCRLPGDGDVLGF